MKRFGIALGAGDLVGGGMANEPNDGGGVGTANEGVAIGLGTGAADPWGAGDVEENLAGGGLFDEAFFSKSSILTNPGGLTTFF